ncbi:MAG: 1-phosphofructokinase [Firmicutes bacterium]|nr:1-phosphofructokinase [Bacillota bacterium]
MIATITPNPSIDRTVFVDELVPGKLHRVRLVRRDPSGKGVNVSRALKCLGMDSIAFGFLGGDPGRELEEGIKALGISTRFTWVSGDTRTNTKVVEDKTGRMTEINEPGPLVSDGDIERLKETILSAAADKEFEFAVLSGSRPPGVPDDFYSDLVALLNKHGVKTILDCDGSALRLGIEARPFMIKPNRFEMEMLFGKAFPSAGEIVEAATDLLGKGLSVVVISLGAEGAIFVRGNARENEICWARAGGPVEPKSTAGCGDTMVASILLALQRGWSWEYTARFAVAAATVAATKEGTQFPAYDEALDALRLVKLVRL